MFRPIYLRVVDALKTEELVPTVGDAFGRATDCRVPASKSLIELLSSEQLQQLLQSQTPVHWVTPDVLGESRRDVLDFLKTRSGFQRFRLPLSSTSFDADFLCAKRRVDRAVLCVPDRL